MYSGFLFSLVSFTLVILPIQFHLEVFKIKRIVDKNRGNRGYSRQHIGATVRAGHRLWGFRGVLRGEWKLWEILAVQDQRNPSDFSVPTRTNFLLKKLSSSRNGPGPHLDYTMAFNGQTPTIVVLKEGPFPPPSGSLVGYLEIG